MLCSQHNMDILLSVCTFEFILYLEKLSDTHFASLEKIHANIPCIYIKSFETETIRIEHVERYCCILNVD